MDAKEILKIKLDSMFKNMDKIDGHKFREIWNKYDDDGKWILLSNDRFKFSHLGIELKFSVSKRYPNVINNFFAMQLLELFSNKFRIFGERWHIVLRKNVFFNTKLHFRIPFSYYDCMLHLLSCTTFLP